MKILFSCVPFDRGQSGMSVYFRQLVHALSAQGHRLTLIVEKDAAGFFPGHEKIILPSWTKPAFLSMFYHLWILPFRIDWKKYDFAVIGAANRRAFCRYPVFTEAVVHDLSQYHVREKYDVFRMWYVMKILPFFVRRAPSVIAVSCSTAADLEKFWRIPKDKIQVVCNGLPLPDTDRRPHPGSGRETQEKAPPCILYVSRLEHPGKNHVNLIRAFDRLPPELAGKYQLVLPGAPWNGADKIYEAARKSGYSGQIVLPGFVSSAELEKLYRRAACCIFPSFFEGFGLPLIEAMSRGIPCACSGTSSLGEIGEGAAWLFQPDNPAGMAEALERVLCSKPLRRRLCSAGRKRASEFNWNKTASRMTAIFQSAPPVRIFDIPFSNCTMTAALKKLDRLVKRRSRFAAFINAHALNTACEDAEYAEILRGADAVWPDGSGIRMAGRLLHFPVPENVNGTDMFPLICRKPYRIYLLGGAPGVAARACGKAAQKFPRARFVGAAGGFFPDEAEENAVIAEINAADPDILLVGMGIPLQEKWIARHRGELRCGLAIGVGGLFDFVSERIPRAPLWLRKAGLEWCYRLYREPFRLARRYLIGNPLFLFRLLFRGK